MTCSKRAGSPIVAEGRLLGGVIHFSDMAQYGSGGSATAERNASGFRLRL